VYARIVTPVAGSDAAFGAAPTARVLGEAWHCPVDVVHVATPGSRPPEVDATDRPVRHLDGTDVAATLVAEVSGRPPGLLCMAPRSRPAPVELLFGAVTRDVLRNLGAPLVLVGSSALGTAPTRLGRLLLCLDGSPTAETILPTVWEWAGELDLEVHVLHVAPPLPHPREGDFDLPEVTRDATARVEEVTAELDEAGLHARARVVEGADVPGTIVEQASWLQVDLIAMATHGRDALDRMLVGSVTDGVVRRSPIPVLAYRPGILH
jgi:nucleotide-binding universal stress UspA family protein